MALATILWVDDEIESLQSQKLFLENKRCCYYRGVYYEHFVITRPMSGLLKIIYELHLFTNISN